MTKKKNPMKSFAILSTYTVLPPLSELIGLKAQIIETHLL